MIPLSVSSESGSRFTRLADYLAVDFGGCNSAQLTQVYCMFAELCVHWDVHSALLKSGDDHPEGHYALVDALRRILETGGIPWDFKLALVPCTSPIEAVYRHTQHELRLRGVNAWVFESTSEAVNWLEGRAIGGPMVS